MLSTDSQQVWCCGSPEAPVFIAGGRITLQEAPCIIAVSAVGRKNEARAVELYQELHPEISVNESGLVVHPDKPFLAASPDRVLVDPVSGEQGVLEVKCPSSVDVPPTCAAGQLPSFCLEKVDEHTRLKRSHPYFWQVLGQMACCKVRYCDFVVMSGGELFV